MGFYTQWIISFSTAARNSKVSKPTLNCVSSQGYCRLNDKSRHNGYQAKILYLSIIARQQITAYDLFIQKLCKLENIKIDFKRTDEYLLVDKYTSRNGKYRLVTMPFSMRVAQSLVSKIEQLNLPFLNELIPNAARHFLRSKALNDGLPPEVIDALLGHWHMGSEPWSSYGLFDFKDFAQPLSPSSKISKKNLTSNPQCGRSNMAHDETLTLIQQFWEGKTTKGTLSKEELDQARRLIEQHFPSVKKGSTMKSHRLLRLYTSLLLGQVFPDKKELRNQIERHRVLSEHLRNHKELTPENKNSLLMCLIT